MKVKERKEGRRKERWEGRKEGRERKKGREKERGRNKKGKKVNILVSYFVSHFLFLYVHAINYNKTDSSKNNFS